MNTGHFQVCFITERTYAYGNEAKYTWKYIFLFCFF